MTGSIITTLLVLEFVFRFFSPPQPPLPRDSGDNARAVDTTRNALGLREPWESVPGGADAVRIAFLGDSFTFAACVEQRDGFVDKIERILNPEGRLRYVTINVGQPGTDPRVQSEMYAGLKSELRPHVLVHVVYCNDANAVACTYTRSRFWAFSYSFRPRAAIACAGNNFCACMYTPRRSRRCAC